MSHVQEVMGDDYYIMPKRRIAQEYVNQLEFKEFDIKQVQPFFFGMLTAPRCTGKSHALKQLLCEIKDWFSNVYCFCPTFNDQPTVYDYIPKENVISSFDEVKIQMIWDYCSKKKTEHLERGLKSEDLPKTLLIFDDVIDEDGFKKSRWLCRLASKGRHKGICVIVLSQYFCAVNKLIRENLDFFGTFQIINKDDIDNISRSFLSAESTDIGYKIYRKILPEKYHMLFVDCKKVHNDPTNYIFHFKASDSCPKFMIKTGNIFEYENNETDENLNVIKDKLLKYQQKIDKGEKQIIKENVKERKTYRKKRII